MISSFSVWMKNGDQYSNAGFPLCYRLMQFVASMQRYRIHSTSNSVTERDNWTETSSTPPVFCMIWDFHSGDYEECRLLGYKNQVRTSQQTHYVSGAEPSRLMLCKIWGFYGGDYEGCRLLGTTRCRGNKVTRSFESFPPAEHTAPYPRRRHSPFRILFLQPKNCG
jgi:hypothetical protein